MRSKESRDGYKDGLTDIAAQTGDHRPGIHMHAGVIGEATAKSGEFPAIVTDAAKRPDKVGGTFLWGAFGFTHEQQVWVETSDEN
jgi:hypothetical protein